MLQDPEFVEVKRLCAKRYVDYVRRLEANIDEKAASVNQQKERLELMGVSYDTMRSSGGGHDGLPNGIAALFEMLDEASTDLIEYREQRKIAEDVFGRLSSPEMSRVFRARYLHNRDWQSIAATQHYSYQGVMSLHRRGLVEVYDLMPEEWRRMLPKAV